MAASPQPPRPLDRLLDYLRIEEGELEPTLLLGLYLLLGMASVICLKAVSDSVFLSVFDARRLPYVDLSITVLVGIVVSLYVRLWNRWGLPGTIKLTQAFVVLNLFVSWLMLRAHLAGTPVLIYVSVGIFAVLLPSQVWSLAGIIFDTRQAKRLFSLIASGGILGALLGGSFAGFIGPALGTESVLLATIGFVLACAAIVTRLSRLAKSASPAAATGTLGRGSILESVRLVGSTRYLLLITLAIFFSTIAGTLIKYQFKAVAQVALAADRDALTSFSGYFYGYIAVFSFLFHTLLTGRILRLVGLSSCLFILPMALLSGSMGLFFSTSLVTAILARGADQGFRHSIDRATVELLYVPVPTNIRSRVKSFMDMVVSRSADAIASIVLLGLVSIGRTQVEDISWVNLLFIAPWLFMVWQLRGEYVRTLRSTIERKDIQAEELLRSLAESSPPAELESTLQGSDQRSLETAIDWMQYGGANAGRAHLASLLTHSSPTIRRKAMAVVANHRIPRCEREVLSFLGIESDIEARWQALEYLEEQGGSAADGALEEMLEGGDRALAATVAARLLHRPGANSARASEVFFSYIEWAAQAEPPSRAIAARLIGLAPASERLHVHLSRALRDPTAEVRRAALQSASAVRPREEISLLVERLCDPSVRREARNALVAFGSPILGEMGKIVRDGSLAPRGRREVFRIIGLIGGQQAADLLVEHIRSFDRAVLSEVLGALNRIRRRQPEVTFDAEVIKDLLVSELRDLYQEAVFLAGIPASGSNDGVIFLRRALRERLDRHRDGVFQLLALVYPHREILDARHWIFSGRPDLRSNALEFLDSRISNPVRQMLLPVLEERGEKRMAEAGQELFDLDEIPYPSVLRRLLEWPDAWLQSCASYVVGEARLFEFRPILLPLAVAADPILSETAARAGARLSAKTTPPGSSALDN
jgi:AAA family ATP:ADP antiporter